MSLGPRQQPRRLSAPDSLPNSCADCEARVEAARIIGASNDAIADAIKEAITTFAPLAHAATDVMNRLDLLCLWLKTKGLLLVAGAPWVLWLMGVITPEAAKAFSNFVKAFGG